MKRNLIITLAGGYFFLFLSPLFAASLFDREAKKVIEDCWNSTLSNVKIRLGEFSVVNEFVKADINKKQLNTQGYKWVQAWEKVGVITIEKDKSLEDLKSGKKFNMDAYARRTLGDEVAHIWIKATHKGTELGKKAGLSQDQNLIVFPQGAFTITDVVKNEERKKGVDEYRLIMLKYQAQWDTAYEEHSKALGKSLSKDRKAICLLKYDNFEGKWKYITGDYANSNEEFTTKYVEKALEQ